MAVEFAQPSSPSLPRSTLDIPSTARSITFNTFGKDRSGGCRVCSTPISTSFGRLSTPHQQRFRSCSTPFERTGVAAVEFAQPPSRPFLRSTLDISLTARSVAFNTFRKDKSGGCRVCSTPISSFSSVHSRHPTNGAFNHVQRLSRGWEWRLLSLLDPHLVLLRSTLDISPTARSSCSTPFERTGVAAVEFARPPSRPFLRSTFDISPTARSVTFNTF